MRELHREQQEADFGDGDAKVFEDGIAALESAIEALKALVEPQG